MLSSIGLLVSSVICELLREGVSESRIDGIHFYPEDISDDHLSKLILKNTSSYGKELHLRKGMETSSLCGWNIQNRAKNWSFKLSFNEPNLSCDEKAGIYLHYTKEYPNLGVYKGGLSTFHGIVAGIEFSGKSVELVFSHNNGKEYLENSIFPTMIDSISPKRLSDVTEIDMKIISTIKNIRIELYEKDRLLYDGFRLFNAKELREFEEGGYFSITTTYHEVASSKTFVLKRAEVFERKEDDKTYDPYLRVSSPPVVTLRPKEEINHPNTDIKELIHKAEELLIFIRHTFGDISKNVIVRGQETLDTEINSVQEKIKRYLEMNAYENTSLNQANEINRLETGIKRIKRNIHELNYLLKKVMGDYKHDLSLAKYIMLMVGSGMFAVLIYRDLQKTLSRRRKRAVED